ncbi:SMODS and SLOG-associating 2TM effector domain-containing protein [Sphingomonas antarctica]|uniref:hypothetical protein n=1 Tax=Sphingomonas antarctica TaxID=2040274 RepID=UPI0039E8FAC2
MSEGDDLQPRQTLGIGVTGHRLERLGDIDLAELSATVVQVFAAIETATSDVTVEATRLITGLAEGADMIAAHAGLTRGWLLDAVLPFARDEFARDFAEGAERTEYQDALSSASAVFELPGDRAHDGAAYERVGRVVLAQSDVLVAVWDGGAGRGRGGAAQIVAEAVLAGIPVIHIDPAAAHPPRLLWDRLEEHDLGQQTVDTVPRAGLERLPVLIAHLLAAPSEAAERAMLDRFTSGVVERERWFAFAYPWLLRSMARGGKAPVSEPPAAPPETCFSPVLARIVTPRFVSADRTGSALARLFRSGYVTNFTFAALAVILSLMGLVLPPALKPLLIASEVVVIGAILLVTRAGNRAQWHRRWLDHRHLAERLRVLTIGAQLGDLDLRAEASAQRGWVGWYARATARQIGLPTVRVDANYLECVRGALTHLIDDQIGYLRGDAARMHRLEHRLHKLGGALFITTAAVCVLILVFKLAAAFDPETFEHVAKPVGLAATIISAALPAIGAAIYGIRMQGDLAGTSERSAGLAAQLVTLKTVIAADALDFDTLTRRTRRAADLLTRDLATWLHTYHARPLTLPG